MKTMELVNKVHNDAKAKGWWEKPRSIQELFMLCITEIAEATEEERKGNAPVYFNTPTGVVTMQDLGGEMNLKVGDVAQKPEGALIELADVVIRLFDIAGAHNFDMARLEGKEKDLNTAGWENPLCFHFDLCQTLCFGNRPAEQNAVYTYMLIRAYCAMRNWDLQRAVESKIAYNETRAHRHGGKKY